MPLEILSLCMFLHLFVCWSLISLLLVYQMLLLVPPTFLLSVFLLRFDHCPACLSVCLSVCLSPSFSLFDWMHMRQKLHTNNLIFWLTGWQGVRAERRERWKRQSRSHIKPVGSQPCLEKKKYRRQMEGWRDINECRVLSRWYSSSLTFLSH